MRSRVECLTRAALLLVAAILVTAPAGVARSQVIEQPALDHLKCYRINDGLQPAIYVADLRNQFGLEPGCQIGVPARLFCVETDKTVLTPPPPGGGPSGTPAGHFLCYRVQCPTIAPIPKTTVEDQFGRRTITFLRERLLCAPANKLICGDGDLDPGEQCDPGSAATNVCPGGTPCNADCTCPTGVCCRCPDMCVNASGTMCPPGCEPVVGAICDNHVCQTCPCGRDCVDDAGNVGQCQLADPTTGVCECKAPPECPCGQPCTDSAGVVGECQPTNDSNVCECKTPPNPCPCGTPCTINGAPGTCMAVPGATECVCQPQEECPCGQPCTNAAGEVGVCRPSNDSSVCDCQVPPNPCPCGTTCLTDEGAAGTCEKVAGGDQCKCRKKPPPECPCNTTCAMADGSVGLCLRSAEDKTCHCMPPPSECQCGKPCVGPNGLPGRCRPVPGAAGTCACAEG